MASVSFWQRLFGTSEWQTIDDPRLRSTLALDQMIETLDIFELPIVVAARGLLADTTAMLPISAIDDDTGKPVNRQPSMIRRPDPAEPYRLTMERLVNQMTRHGGCWLEILEIGSNGYPLGVRVVDHGRVFAQLDAQTLRVVEITVDGRAVNPRRWRYIPFIVDDGPIGRSPLADIQPALTQLAETYRYWAAYYSGAATPPYAVVHPNRLTAEQARTFADQWQLARMERRPAVLSGGIELQTYQASTAQESLLTDAVASLDATVCRVLRIPPSLLNTESHGSLTYSTTTGEFHRWLVLGLYPMVLSRIEATMSDLLPRGQSVVFDTRNLTRGDLTGDELSPADDPAAPLEVPDATVI